jgi:capsular polysaccharide biosynthesis protein
MRKRVHHFDPSRLQPVSKFIDCDYAPKAVVVPATSELRTPLPGRIWHDKFSKPRIARNFSARKTQFADTIARSIRNPLLAEEMVLIDEKSMYLDASISLQYEPKQALAEVTERFANAVRRSLHAPVEDRYRDDTLLISHHEGGTTWGHYLIQSVPRMLLFLDAFPLGKIALPTWHADDAPGFGEALEIYKIPKQRLAPIEASTVYRCKEAILLDFLFNFEDSAPHPKVLTFLRNFSTVRAKALSRNRAAFIRRRADAKRAIGNERAVDAVMARYGIDVYGPDDLPLRKQIEIWRSHDLVIATLGSDLANMVYARPGSRVLALSPHWFGDAFFFELSVAAGIAWYELRCGVMPTREPEEERNQTFNVDVDLLASVLDSLLRKSRL